MYKIQIESELDDNQGHLIDNIDNVSTKIKALPKDQIHKATAEIEIGEYVMNPDTLSLHKALGKRHSKGGTPVNIPDNSFIFSDFKDLGFNKSDKERFEFKLGGTKLKNNTPAKVLEKNLDIKHHNKMINILNSNSQDDIAKNSANLMLTKNLETIGKVAYVQEGKKGFPQGIPPFSQGTAPVYKKEVDNDITQSIQFMKQGGSMIPKYQQAGYIKRPKTEEERKLLYDEWLYNSQQFFPQLDRGNFDAYYNQPDRLQSYYANDPRFNGAVVDMMKREGMTNLGRKLYGNKANYTDDEYLTGFKDNKFDWRSLDVQPQTYDGPQAFEKLGYKQVDPEGNVYYTGQGNSYVIPQFRNELKNITFTAKKNPLPALDYTRPNEDNSQFTPDQIFGHIKTPTQSSDLEESLSNTGLNAGDISEPYTNQFQPVGFTPWQNFNMALPLINKLGIKSQYPLYQQQRSVAPEQTLMSADPYLNQIGQDYNQAANMNRVMSPLQSYANNSELYGKKLDATNNVLNQINQGNAQIQNQQNQLAAQTYNGDMMNNLKFNKQYYDELSTTVQNKERYKDFYNNQFMTNANQMIAENQAFNNILSSQQTFDGQPLYTPVSNGFGYSMQFNPRAQRDILNGQYGQGNNSNEVYQGLLTEVQSATTSAEKAAAWKNFLYYQNMMRPKAQKGGFIPKFKL